MSALGVLVRVPLTEPAPLLASAPASFLVGRVFRHRP